MAKNVVSILMNQDKAIAAESIHRVKIFAYEVDKNPAIGKQHDHERFVWFQQSMVNGGKPSTTVPAHILKQAMLNMQGVEKQKKYSGTAHILLVAGGGLLVMKTESAAASTILTRMDLDLKKICSSQGTTLIRTSIQGIVNSNNSCWINAAFQCFLALQSIQDLLANPESTAFDAYKRELLVLNVSIHSKVSKPVASIEKNLKSLVGLFPSFYKERTSAQENSFLLLLNLIKISGEVKPLFSTDEIQMEQCNQCSNTVQAGTRHLLHHVLDVSTILRGQCKNIKAMLELNAFGISLTKHCKQCKVVTQHAVSRSSSYNQVICFEFSRDTGDNKKLPLDHFQVEHSLEVKNKFGFLQSFQLSTACVHIGKNISEGHFIVLRIVINSEGTSYLMIDDSLVTPIDLGMFNTYLKQVSYVLYTATNKTMIADSPIRPEGLKMKPLPDSETLNAPIYPMETVSPSDGKGHARKEPVPTSNDKEPAPSFKSGFFYLKSFVKKKLSFIVS